ncbi:WD40 repeat-like protein [Panus rudis PR-1116 ss-1]|nr:WD40 repeat-like protein [Panus rudis PR-1116 ss-1]
MDSEEVDIHPVAATNGYGYNDVYTAATKLRAQRPSYSQATAWKRRLQFDSLDHTLDRVNVLGNGDTIGHTGCVNALSWARNGELLLSGGDDTTVRIWRMDTSDTSQEYPFVCDAVIRTGHRSNIFNAQMLPHSTRIATVARDKQVRVFDVTDVLAQPGDGRETVYTARQTSARVLRCHNGSVKRVTTEDSPDVFLTVSEDGTVRQHDLRAPHTCQSGGCPAPLVQFSHGLSTLSMSPLTPWQFVVAGESPYGYLFDRRQIGRRVEQEWGVPPDSTKLTTCVRRFGRPERGSGEMKATAHITGSRMASSNGHEVLLSYSADAVYLYSVYDDPVEPSKISSGILAANDKPPRRRSSGSESQTSRRTFAEEVASGNSPEARRVGDELNELMERDIQAYLDEASQAAEPSEAEREEREQDVSHDHDEDEDEDMSSSEDEEDGEPHSDIPVVLPRSRYADICNVETVKDVNFLGPTDEFVASGSDDGNLFIWKKNTGKLHDILEGDEHVVNVIECHPYLPLIAASGIDHTVKLFAPTRGRSSFSRMHDSEAIIKRNVDASARRMDLSTLITYARIAHRVGALTGEDCTTQ